MKTVLFVMEQEKQSVKMAEPVKLLVEDEYCVSVQLVIEVFAVNSIVRDDPISVQYFTEVCII